MPLFNIKDRFFRYVKVHTTSDPGAPVDKYPSTDRQRKLASILVDELQEMGIRDAHMDEHSVVYATIPATSKKTVPTICFCSHMDTSPDSSGKNVNPIIHENFDGEPIVLPDDPDQVITKEDHPALLDKIGEDIITASGKTLLGADDKSGIAVIMAFADYLMKNPSIKHGDIRILFTCDEEIGRGVNRVDMQKLNADIGYTLDGSDKGVIEDETFSADAVTVNIAGIVEHPGYAYNKLVSALKAASAFVHSWPSDRLSPETTKGDQGFVHPVSIEGTVEKASINYIIRDFDTDQLDEKFASFKKIAAQIKENFPGLRIELDRKEQYRNMKYVIKDYPDAVDNALEAMKRIGINPKKEKVRGGTDGSRLSFMGLPCPNLFTGQHAIHGKQEWISLQDMEKSTEMLVELVKIFEEKAKT
ncbi:MAG: peptidase T [Bacteroidetes bacterium]|jgi:tripeptide aminopeptidase|nr:peptidase T [Bacteroidota bacterium]